MRKIYDINMDLVRRDNIKKFDCKQNDDITLHVTILNEGVVINPEHQSPRVLIKKEDGTILYQIDDISISKNVMTIKLRNQATACPGKTLMEIELRDEHGVVSTASIKYQVEERIGSIEDAVESINDISLLDEIDKFIKVSKVDMESMKEDVNQFKEDVKEIDAKIQELQGHIGDVDANIALLQEKNEEAKRNISSLTELNQSSNNVDASLSSKIQEGNTVISNIEAKITELNEIKASLQTIIDNATSEKTALGQKIQEALNIKTELLGTNDEAKLTHTTLAELVEEAKRVIGQVREFIASNSVGDDVAQLKLDVEQLKADVLELKKIDLSNYYNKQEVNDLIQNAGTQVDLSNYYDKGQIEAKLENKADKGISGIIGGSPLPEVFSELDSIIDKEYLKGVKSVIAYNTNASDTKTGAYFIALFDYIPGTEEKNKVVTYKYSDGTFGSLSTNESGLKFRCYRKLPNGNWERQSSLDSSHYIKNMEIYALNFPVYNRDNREEVLMHGKEIPKVFGDYNGVINNGLYAVKATASNAPIDGLASGMLEVKTDGDFIYQEYNGDEDTYHRTRVNGNWNPWVMDGAGGSDVDLSAYATTEYVNNKFDSINIPDSYTKTETYNKDEIDKNTHLKAINVESTHNKIPNHGLVSSMEVSYQNPLWDAIPEDTYINVPANPNPSVYKWYMKCTHYNYHMVFYFDIDPTDKIAVIDDPKGKMFKWLDRTFTYDKYKGFYKSKTTGTSWSAFANDNHFASTTRTINEMYGHNFNLMNGNNLEEIYYRGIAENEDEIQHSVTSFDTAINKKHYKVKQEVGELLDGSPRDGKLYGFIDVLKVGEDIKQVLTSDSNEKYERVLSNALWSPWKKYNVEEIASEQIATLGEINKDDIIDSEFTPELLNYITPSVLEMNEGNLRIEYGEYLVDAVKNSEHVDDPTREYTDIIMLKKGGFKKVLGCMAFVDKLDFHYSFYVQPKVVLVDPSNKPDCLRLYLAYTAPDSVKRDEAWHPINGIKKIKYCVFGY